MAKSTQFFVSYPSKMCSFSEKIKMGDTVSIIDHIQRLLRRANATFMYIDTESKRNASKRIVGFAKRFGNWIEVTSKPKEPEKVVLP